ncbi:uncharacterized protein K02A2.6, partial [Trichonephila clavipes]
NHGTANCRLTPAESRLIRALQIKNDSHSHKVTVQFDKFDEENENFDSFIEGFETYLDVQNVPIANRAKVFVSSLSAKLYQLLKNLLAPDIPSDQTLSFSRLPKTSEELEVKDDITIFQMSQIEALPVTSKELRQETSKDIELGPLLRALREGKDLQGREAQYTIEDGCIMYGQRVCIPKEISGRTFWKNYMLDT